MSDVKAILVRPLEPSDAADLQRLATARDVMHGTLQMPSRSRANVEKRYADVSDPGRHNYVAEIDKRVVGMAGLMINAATRTRHSAELYIMVHDDFQGRGVGKALMQAIVELADDFIGLVRIQLEVNTDNARAIALYERFGFVREGRLRANVLRSGVLIDSYVMGRVREPPKIAAADAAGGAQK